MAIDRDLGVAFVRALGRRLDDGWETTASTGIRGLRLLGETGAFRRFLFTEADPLSFGVLRANVERVPGARARLADGRLVPADAPFDYVDVDPYGSPLPFLGAAVAATRTGGVLAVTATDMTVLAGAQASACRRRYGAQPVRGRLGPEGALRILLMALARVAGEGGRRIDVPLACVGSHHIRAYVELGEGTSPAAPVGVIDAEGWAGPELAGGSRLGPLWLGPLVEPGLAAHLAVPAGAERPTELERLIRLLREDAAVTTPFYYEANTLASALGLRAPPALEAMLQGIRSAGYRAGRTHVRPEGFRTDAPRTEVERIARDLHRPA